MNVPTAIAGQPRGAEEPRAATLHGVTIVFPCLNEADGIGECVASAFRALDAAGLQGEVVVVDNGSSDGSAAVAADAGARVVFEEVRGYGAACLRGLREAAYEYVVLLDADGTYPVARAGDFVQALDRGADLVMGNRFGGSLERDAMPFLNRYLGNPLLSGMTRMLFGVRIRDIHCGMRALRRSRLEELDLRTPGMEFATEMVVKAADRNLAMAELPIDYHPRVGESKLQPLRDGWRHIEYMLVLSPAAFFLLPGLLLTAFGMGVQVLLVSGPRGLFLRVWDYHASLAGMAASLLGVMLFVVGALAATHARSIGVRFRHSRMSRLIAAAGSKPARWVGSALTGAGTLMWLGVVWRWIRSGFGSLQVVSFLSLATTLLATGVALICCGFLIHVIEVSAARRIAPDRWAAGASARPAE